MSAKKSTGLESTNVERVWVATSRTPMTPRELSAATGLTVQAVTAALRKLEQTDAMQRAESDPKMWLRVKGVRALPESLRPSVAVEDAANAAAVDGMAEEMAARVVAKRRGSVAEATEGQPETGKKLQVMNRAELEVMALSLDIEGVTTRTKKAKLVELITARRAELAAEAETDAALDRAPKAELVELATGLGLSPAKKTTADQLRALIRAHRSGPAVVAVIVDGATVLATDQPAAEPAQDDAEPSNVIAGPWGTPGGPEALSGDPDGVDGVLADLMASRPVSAPPAPASRRPRAVGSGEARPRREAGGAVPVRGDRSTQWGRGQLAAAIVAVLIERGPEFDCTASGMTKILNESRADGSAPIAQAGAVKYALENLVKGGGAVRTSEAPKRYTGAVQVAA